MAVHTALSSQQVTDFIKDFDLGELQAFADIETGITNSNFHLTTTEGQFVLTLFEELTANELPFYVDLCTMLQQQEFPCPKPYQDRYGQSIKNLSHRPAILMDFLPGTSIDLADAKHITAIGDTLGRLHLLGQSFPQKQPNTRGKAWREASLEPLLEILPVTDALLLQEELGNCAKIHSNGLPKGIIHGDLFPDNVLFVGDKVSAVVDFYYACYDDFLLDLAIVANAWCHDGNGQLDQILTELLINAYQQHRPLTQLEKTYWPAMRQAAALRYWISRLTDYYYRPQGKLVPVKDPNEYRDLLLQLRNYDAIINAIQ